MFAISSPLEICSQCPYLDWASVFGAFGLCVSLADGLIAPLLIDLHVRAILLISKFIRISCLSLELWYISLYSPVIYCS